MGQKEDLVASVRQNVRPSIDKLLGIGGYYKPPVDYGRAVPQEFPQVSDVAQPYPDTSKWTTDVVPQAAPAQGSGVDPAALQQIWQGLPMGMKMQWEGSFQRFAQAMQDYPDTMKGFQGAPAPLQ